MCSRCGFQPLPTLLAYLSTVRFPQTEDATLGRRIGWAINKRHAIHTVVRYGVSDLAWLPKSRRVSALQSSVSHSGLVGNGE